MLLYKYRSLSNLEYALDIFVNARLHAAKFTELNDPMEGIYTYKPGQFNQQARESLLRQKVSKRILSLSETPNDMLMWTYYAQAHTGMVVGVSVVDADATVEPVKYVDRLTINTRCVDVAQGILVKKLKLWSHEKEQRAFIHQKDFISVQVCKLIFGLNVNGHTAALITKIAERFCPGIEVSKIRRHDLDKGQRDELNV